MAGSVDSALSRLSEAMAGGMGQNDGADLFSQASPMPAGTLVAAIVATGIVLMGLIWVLKKEG